MKNRDTRRDFEKTFDRDYDQFDQTLEQDFDETLDTDLDENLDDEFDRHVDDDLDDDSDSASDFEAKIDQRVEEIFRAFAFELGETTAAFVDAFLDENQLDPPLLVETEASEASNESNESSLVAEAGHSIDSSRKTEETNKSNESSLVTEAGLGIEAGKVLEIKPHRRRNILRRSAIIAATLILIMGLAVVTSEGVRLKVTSLFRSDAPNSIRIIDDSNLVVDLEKVQLGYVPEGFEVESDETFLDMERKIKYSDVEEKAITLLLTKTEMYSYNVDNESNDYEEVKINDKQGYIFLDGMNNVIVWQMGDCTVQLSSTVNNDELIKIASNVKVY